MLKSQMAAATTGGVVGAILAIAVAFAVLALGVLPDRSDKRFHDYLMQHPEILAEMSTKLQAQQAASEEHARQVAVSKIGLKAYFDPRIAFVTGPAGAKTTFVEFFDYNCPYCRASVPTVKKFMAAHRGNARFAFIEFPIKGPQSTIASRAAIAARKQSDRYLDFHFLLMNEQELVTEDVVYADAAKAGLNVTRLKADMQDSSIDAAIAGAHRLAAATSVDGTPAFIIDGRIHEGAIDDATIRELVKPS